MIEKIRWGCASDFERERERESCLRLVDRNNGNIIKNVVLESKVVNNYSGEVLVEVEINGEIVSESDRVMRVGGCKGVEISVCKLEREYEENLSRSMSRG